MVGNEPLRWRAGSELSPDPEPPQEESPGAAEGDVDSGTRNPRLGLVRRLCQEALPPAPPRLRPRRTWRPVPGPLAPSVCLELTLPPTQLNLLLILPGRQGGLVVSLGRVLGAETPCLGPAVDAPYFSASALVTDAG